MNISLDISCDVELIRSETGEIGWSSNVEDAFQVSEKRDSLTVRQKDRGGMTITSGHGSTFISGGGRSIVIGDVCQGATVIGGGGGVWVNGKRVDAMGEDSPPKHEIPFLTVRVPIGVDVEIRTSGSSRVYGNAEIGHLKVNTSGSSSIAADVYSASLNTSGSSDIALKLRGNKLSSSFSGSTSFALVQEL